MPSTIVHLETAYPLICSPELDLNLRDEGAFGNLARLMCVKPLVAMLRRAV